MATNREKYIDNATNEELAIKFMDGDRCQFCTCKKSSCDGMCVNHIAKWLSQEVEEDKTKIISDYEKHEIIQLTKKAYEDILARLDKLEDSKNDIRPLIETDKNMGILMKEILSLQERVKELEESEYHNAMAIERLEKINEYESNVDDVETKTADEMFEELGYDKTCSNDYWITYEKENNSKTERIYIDKSGFGKLHNLRGSVVDYLSLITEAEDKAIHKKIEELKNEKRRN